ncbi:MAG: hypothetical protein JWM11_6728 [Planctomycetaceae bacterium]|nr:hypothetical protein [Planctomycetaceae bacterium]
MGANVLPESGSRDWMVGVMFPEQLRLSSGDGLSFHFLAFRESIMQIPVIRGIIDRRILVNYRVDPSILAPLLPAPFRPKVIHGTGMAGICLIRLKQVRPAFLPAWLGMSSENAAHRTAVEWDDNGQVREGVYVRRRDTSSWLNALAGGRIFPGLHNHGKFTVTETSDRFSVALRSDDGVTSMSVRGHRTGQLPAASIFKSLDEASAFFQGGSLGYSATPDPSRFQGLTLRCLNWQVEPLQVEEVQSSFFENEAFFPKGTTEFDCALLMRGIDHEWHGESDLCCNAKATTDARGAPTSLPLPSKVLRTVGVFA